MPLKRFGNHIVETGKLLCVKPDGQLLFADGTTTLVAREAAAAMIVGLTEDKSPLQPEIARRAVVTPGVAEAEAPPLIEIPPV